MAVIGELVEWVRTSDDDAEIAEGRFDLGGGDMVTCVDYMPSGYDAHPVPGDFAVLVPAPESGSYVIVGWVDPWNQGVAKEGEQRMYARSGVNVVGALHVTVDGQKPDGILTELIARADRTDAALNALASLYNAHLHDTTATIGAGSTVGVVSPPKKMALGDASIQSTTHAVGCDKVYVT